MNTLRTIRQLTVLTAIAMATAVRADSPAASITIECDAFRYSIGPDGRNRGFFDKATGVECLAQEPSPCSRLKKASKEYPATKASREGDRLQIEFGGSGVSADLRFTPSGRRVVVEVIGVKGDGLDELTFIDVPLKLKGQAGEPFAACCLALNLKTNVQAIPGPSSRLRAMCYPRFGVTGAQAALVGCPTGQLRQALQEAVSAAPDVPHSPLGGPWALDAEINQGSYLFNFGGLTEQTVDEWINATKACGMNQIDFTAGASFRLGDLHLNPDSYPRGKDSLKAVIDKLHAAGIKAGLHTYAFFMDKSCPWVTPVPDKRLGKDATFTLTADLTTDAATVPVSEPTEKMSLITGPFIRNSVTLQIDDELIVYTGTDKKPPYGFTGCQRGACGTKAAPHAKGAKIGHLRECFGLFLPDGDSTLFEEVAARTAEVFNDCGFDMMYLDALDGEDAVAGSDVGWHYGSKFVFEICKRIKRPALVEMSTFHHHLWYVRSRYEAWDTSSRGHKSFVDIHVKANAASRQMFLPGHLGWCRVITWAGDAQTEPTYIDDIEYLCCKALGTDTGFSLQGVEPSTLRTVPAFKRFAGIMRQYEELRHAKYFPEAVTAKLREPGKEYTLVRKGNDGWTFRPVKYDKHTVDALDGKANVWTTTNPFGRQPLKLRIEALTSAGPYDTPTNPVLADFTKPGDFAGKQAAAGITAQLTSSSEQVRAGTVSGRYTAANPSTAPGVPAWTSLTKTFTPPLNLQGHQALGLWVHGDGNGEVLNLQLRSPAHVVAGFGEHYILIDFTGWRYIELIETEGDRCSEYSWPYGDAFYALYREPVAYDQVASLGLWFNRVPPGKTATCYLSPIKALPLVKTKLANPSITLGGQTLTFPVTMDSGSYLELSSSADCKLYGPNGELLSEVKLPGDMPTIERGPNRVEFRCGIEGQVNPRARVTVIAQGEPLD